METAIEKLGPDAAKKVNLVFITIDPERDKPKLLTGLCRDFGPTFIGLTGTPQQIADVARAIASTTRKCQARMAGLPDGSFPIVYRRPQRRFVTHSRMKPRRRPIAASVGAVAVAGAQTHCVDSLSVAMLTLSM